ncbi:SRPBCC family protein [Couchioplanes caeruleus]|uniref:SRPBCC family protein n=1 Tax=Couchioplanes caeruleus TaxID=56438 RepID=UPI0020BEC07E|nr:SRPBCC family protein [Couchioplanes caeruleus]UQU63426.1 SRPBCC family protein [Couchioplanes caeruleus]
MITVSRTFTVAAPVPAVLAYLRDLGNSADWDPAGRRTTRVDAGPVAVGASWRGESRILGVRAELTYTLVEAAGDRLVFAGHSEGAGSTETITVRPAPAGAEVTYRVDLEVHGLAKLAAPVLRLELEKLGTGSAGRLTAVLNGLAQAA